MLLTVYDSNRQAKAVLSPDDSSTQVKAIQSDNVLTLSFTLYEYVALEVNDYVDFEGERYWLQERYLPDERNTQEWKYDVKFYGIESLMRRFLVLNVVDGDPEPVFTLTAPPREHMALIVKSINDGMGGVTDWKVGRVEGTGNVVIDYEGTKDGVAFDGGAAKGYELALGSHTFIPGFEEQVAGMSAGEEKDIDITFPADYHAEELAGKPVVFKVKVHEVKETAVPEKDDEFVKDVSEFDTVAELRADIEKRIRDEKQAGIDRAFENAAVEKAAANMTVELPDSMIDEELDQEMERMDYELRSQGASLQAYAQMMGGDMNAIRNSLRPSAQAAVRTNVLLDAVAAAENIEVSEEECEEEYKKLAESYKMELDDVKKALNADGLKSDLKLRKAARLIADSAVAVAPKAPEAAEEAPASEE